ncbi:hypothetical protein OSSY52_11210 [Tepiditoga spiralis]|uniref:CBM20 domain-containing protein n=1 Tax=Tepiditoga spiralis TaxID=2108365 RepID=A0A7G1G3I7_9BACT|nr:hypothetical protein [Tepiditoga spiralis]BBE30980.1 hypothetical protein OSSY52_11210 [Tepiditoga spiralis]
MKKSFYVVLFLVFTFLLISCSANINKENNLENSSSKVDNSKVDDSIINTVTFIIESYPSNTPENSNIYMMGDFNGWNPSDVFYRFEKNEEGEYILKVSMKSGTKINFKITRGTDDSVESDSFGDEISEREYKFSTDGDEVYISIEGWKDLGF